MRGNLKLLLHQLHWARRSISKRRHLVALVAWLLALVGAAVVTVIPNRYEATARIYVDTQTVLKPLMSGLAFQPDIEQRVRMLARTLVSRPNAERLLDDPALGLQPPDPADRERALTRLIDRIIVLPAGGNNLYSITYRDVEPERARRLVQAVMDLFVTTGASGKRRDSEDAGKFIDEQIAGYEAKLVESENRLKDFKLRNFGVSGVSGQDYFLRMSTLADEVNRIRIELQAAEQSRDALKRELSAEEPQLPLTAQLAGAPQVVPEIDIRLESQRRQLDEMLRRYTDLHPDVVSTRRTIAQLEQQKAREAQTKAADQGRGSAATSPIYQRIRVALAEAEAKVAALRSQMTAQQGSLDKTRALAGRVPQAEADLAQLNRDYDILRKNYEQLVARRESALLGVKLDESSQLAEFRVVEPPRVAPKPVFPSRLHLAMIVTALAFVGGLFAALIADAISPAVEDEAGLLELSKRPVLGTVSISENEQALRLERLSVMRFGAALSLLLLLQGVWVTWIGIRNPLG